MYGCGEGPLYILTTNRQIEVAWCVGDGGGGGYDGGDKRKRKKTRRKKNYRKLPFLV